MRLGWVVAVFACGCGRIAFDAVGSDTAGDGGVTCWPAWHTGAPALSIPMPVTEINSVDTDSDMSFSSDGLTLYFASNRPGGPGGSDIWRATRATTTSPFVVVGPMPDVSSGASDGLFQVTSGDLLGWVSSDRAGGSGSYDLWQAARPSTSSSFVLTQNGLANLNLAGEESDPFPARGGLRLYFVREDVGTAIDIYVADRSAIGMQFAPATMVPGINSSALDADPVLSPDELVIVISSERVGGSRDLFFATRSSTAVPFGAPMPPGVANTSSNEQDPALSPDGCELLFTSSRGGDFDIYRSTISP